MESFEQPELTHLQVVENLKILQIKACPVWTSYASQHQRAVIVGARG